MSDWRPIETAPKNGTLIDLWVCGDRCANCFWQAYPWDDETAGEWRQQYAEIKSSGFQVDGDPSHWMSVPEAPK